MVSISRLSARFGAVCLCCLLPAWASAQNVADSVSQFSNVQGQNNWYYGYYDRTHDLDAVYNANTDFQQMTQFNTANNSQAWQTQVGTYWDTISASLMHPNGTITSGGRQSVEHWVVRRWVSNVSGTVAITGHIAKFDANSASNGVLGRIFVDSSQVASQYVSGTDTTGANFAARVFLSPGAKVDFVLDPYQANDIADTTIYTASIAAVPEIRPVVALPLLLTGAATLLWRRKRVYA